MFKYFIENLAIDTQFFRRLNEEKLENAIMCDTVYSYLLNEAAHPQVCPAICNHAPAVLLDKDIIKEAQSRIISSSVNRLE